MTPQQPRKHDPAGNATDSPSIDTAVADCPTDASNPVDARLTERLNAVSRWHALLIGAFTVVLATEATALLPLGAGASVLMLFPVTLTVMYGLLTLFARLESR